MEACHAPGNGKPACIQCDVLGAHEEHLESHDRELGAIASELGSLNRAIGRAPDPLAADDAGRHGSGLLGITHKLANAMQQARPAFASVHEDEGEITRVQDRGELLARAKAAEAALRERDRQSERAVEQKRLRLEGWRLVATVVAAIATGGGVTLLVRLIGG